jgi:hypothetical protein
MLVDRLFFRGEQIEQQRGQACSLKLVGNVTVARAVSTASAPVREQNQARRLVGNLQVSFQGDGPGLDPN